MNIIDFIKQKIKECGSQSALARKTGVSQASINRYTSGDTPSLESIYKIAKAYGLPLSHFYDDTSSLPPEESRIDVLDFLNSRIKEGTTIEELAQKTGLHQDTLTRILNKETKASISAVQRVAVAYNIPTATLMDDELTAKTAAGIADNIKALEDANIDPIKLAYLKQISRLSIEELHQIYLSKIYETGGTPKNLRE